MRPTIRPMTNRVDQIVLLASMGLASWLGMQLVHETGHVIGAWVTGAHVDRVVLNPLTISRTDVSRNSVPLVVVWAGPAFGALAPVLIWLIACVARWSGAYLFRFFAGFCLVANGLYLAVGSFDRIGDCGEMLKHGSPIWSLWLFGILTVPAGVLLWHGQGERFGLGAANGQVNRAAAYGCLLTCLVLLAVGFLVGGE